jgi:hypothetical protein
MGRSEAVALHFTREEIDGRRDRALEAMAAGRHPPNGAEPL